MRTLIQIGLALLVPGGLASAALAATMLGTNRYVPYPPVRSGSEGISWPRGQALPTFATPAAQLDAIEVQALSRDEQITFSVLQGRVNRTQPRMLLLDARTDEGRDTWLNTDTVALEVGTLYTRETKYDLVAKYAGEIGGLVLYDPSLSEHYRNLAGTVAGLRRALPVTVEVLQGLRERGLDLEVLEDLTALPHRTAIEVYQHLYDTYWPHCDKRLILSARPTRRGGDFHHTRDLAAACGAAVVWLDNRIPEERDLMRRFFGDMKAGEGVVLGWYSTERSGVGTASEFGLGTLPADHYLNATVHSGIDHRIRIPPVPRMPVLTNKAYVAVFISDGDNIQYAQRAMRRIWDRSAPSRGRVALNWTIAPGLVDIGPGILNHYYTTATSNDCFVTGPSGMGYMMPFNLYNQAHGLPFNLALSPHFSVRTGGSTAHPDVVADGSPATVWTSTGEGERWVELDLGRSWQISRYVLRHAGAGGLDSAHNTRDYTLRVSGDGQSWTTLDVCRGNTENVTDVEFQPVAARHVRITVEDPGADGTARIADVEIFGRCDPPGD